jgi:hypothetical protein
LTFVTPAKAGIQGRRHFWIPAVAGMTTQGQQRFWISAFAGKTTQG